MVIVGDGSLLVRGSKGKLGDGSPIITEKSGDGSSKVTTLTGMKIGTVHQKSPVYKLKSI